MKGLEKKNVIFQIVFFFIEFGVTKNGLFRHGAKEDREIKPVRR